MAMTSFTISQSETFTQVVLAEVEPKMAFGKQDEQDRTKDGLLLWTAHVVAQQIQFGRKVNDMLRVTIASPRDPSDGIPPFAPVKLHGFQVNVYDASRKNGDTGQREVTGAGVSFRCDRIEAAVKPVKNAAPAA